MLIWSFSVGVHIDKKRRLDTTMLMMLFFCQITD